PLVQAWERLAPPGRTLYLMGDGPLRGELERYVASRRLESIRLTGFIPHEEQGAVRAACGLAVAPSLWEETFGMVVLESWLHGTPVIVTPRGGLPELISHGRNGWIAREPSADALAETLRTALEEEERWPSMGAHGQQLLSSTYSPAAWLQSMGSLLEELRLFRQSPNITAS
ncbi:glycosyltransferase family 4 protein, partial [Akkermansia sp.]